MIQLLRKFFSGPESRPDRDALASTDEWLRAWVAFKLAELRIHRPTQELLLGGTPALPIFGSIGLDTAIDASGKYWIAEYEVDQEQNPGWREASCSERTWITVCAAKNRFGELRVLLPSRPKEASACGNCRGTGFVFNNSVVCSVCSALGWLPANGT